MNGKGKLVAVLIIGLLIGTIAGYVIGFNIGDGNGHKKNDTTQYWFYIDYGAYETSEIHNGWISAQIVGYNPLYALQSVIGATVDSDMALESINGIAPGLNSDGESWVVWTWMPHSNAFGIGTWNMADDKIAYSTTGEVFYLGVTDVDPVTNHPSMDPNAQSGWQKEGPFALIPPSNDNV